MKNILLTTLILFSIIKVKAQCGSFPFSVFEPTITCTSYTGVIVITTTVSPINCIWANTPNIVSGGNTLNPTVNSPGSYSFTLTNTNNGCTTSGIANVSMNAIVPTISVATTGSICSGSSATLTAMANPTNASILWSNGSTSSSISITPSITTNYSVTAIDISSGCSNMALFSEYVNQSCQDVWPGDANSDGIADNLDILELGLHFNQTGTPRTTTSNLWQGYYASNWSGTISNSKNLNHSDCNGDGVINNDDTLSIYNNYGLSHSFKTYQTSIVNPQLSIVPDQAMVAKGSWGSASVYLGDAATTVDNINGVAFTVNFDKTLIEPNSIYIDYQNSFMDLSNQNLDFRKLDFATGKIFTATTHTVNSNVSGYGKIATLHYQILSNLTTDQVLNFSLVQANQSDALGTITSLTTGSGTLMAIGASVGLTEILNNNLISIAPNPTNGLLNITSKTELQKIEIISIAGTLLLSESPTSNNHTLHLENCSNGIYFVNIYQNNRIVRREKVIVNK